MFERTSEHAWTDKTSTVREHIHQCEQFNHIFEMLQLDQNLFDDIPMIIEEEDDESLKRTFFKESNRQNTRILDQDSNWNVLLHKEALYISRSNPPLNNGLKASREPVLFR